jgi:hypothetical protein
MNKTNQMYISLKIIKTLLYSHSALHVSVTGGCMCRVGRLLMMGARVPETCRAEWKYNRVLIILRLMCIWLVLFIVVIADARNHEPEI